MEKITIVLDGIVYDYQTSRYLIAIVSNKKIIRYETRPFEDVEEFEAYQEVIKDLNKKHNYHYMIKNVKDYDDFVRLVRDKRKSFLIKD